MRWTLPSRDHALTVHCPYATNLMPMPRLFTLLTILFGFWSVSAASAAEFQAGEQVRIQRPVEGALFAAGKHVVVTAPVDGDLFAAGFDLRVPGPVTGDALLIGFTLDLSAPIAGDLLLVAGRATVNGPVSGDVEANGANITIAPSSRIGGDFVASGTQITMEGVIAGDARLVGEKVTLAGTIAGNVDVAADELLLLPGARIVGNLRHSGPAPVTVPDGASVAGTVRYREDGGSGDGWLVSMVGRALALFLTGLAVRWLFPDLLAGVSAAVRAHPVRHGLTGIAVMMVTPLLILLLVISMIGIPLGMLMGGLYLLAYPLGLALAAFAVGDMWVRRGGDTVRGRLARFGGATLVLALLSLVPWIGWPILAGLTALGVGALAAALVRRAPVHSPTGPE